MRRLFWALCVIVCATSAVALDRNAFTFTHYDLQVRVEPAKQSIDVTGTVTLRNDSSAPQRTAVLQVSSSLEWHSVATAGKQLQLTTHDYTSDIDHTGALSEAVVKLPREIAPRTTIDLQIAYAGTIPADTTRLTRIGTPPQVAARTDWDRISPDFTAVRGVGYVTWYPISTEAVSLGDGNAVFQAIATWKARQAQSNAKIRVTVASSGPAPEIILNENLRGVTAGGAGGTAGDPTYIDREFDHFELTTPTFAIGIFRRNSAGPLTIFSLPGHEQQATSYTSVVEKVLPLVARWFGRPGYQGRIVELPDPQMMPYESVDVLFTPLTTTDPQQLELTLAHRLTHAAFQSTRLWMFEGLAHFAMALMREQQESSASTKDISGTPPGRKAAIEYMDQQLPPLAAAEESQLPEEPKAGGPAPPPSHGEPLVDATDELFYRTKAMFVWWMLRDMVGDKALQQAIQSYRPEQDKEPAYFQRLLEAQAHRKLEWFFDDWVYRDRGLPDFHVASAYPRAMLPSDWAVTVTVDNTGGAGAEVPVMVRAAHGEVDRRVEIHGHEKGVVRMPVPDVPVEAIVNDGSIPEYSVKNNRLEIRVPGRATE
jgi:aminopeptidase N